MSNSNKTVLVTGGSGYLGTQCILHLLQEGYTVKTTVRSLSKKDTILQSLKSGGILSFEKLSFFQADLNNDEGWSEAVKDCDYVLHVASPFPAQQPEDENELIIPARDGALRVLKAARNAGVKRLVFTSSFAAIGYSIKDQNHVFTEEDWTDPEAPIQPYIKSKTIAEKAAWDFIENEGGNLEFTVINPVGIFGPVLNNNDSASVQVVITGILSGMVKESPDFTLGVVDVRDVADLHIKAMTNPKANGERFLATSDGVMSFYDVAELIRKERPELSANIADMKPTDTSFYIKMSNEKAKSILDWKPISKEEAILASVDTVKIA
ncbi:aldehyde reductase [Flavobacterium sp. ANB]|uniref:SDR family oxidoreductase n=1 Tax=unclassified Flavobacterium TaxID=196869 RepID=UPI0012B6F6BF|nr:MULTISPECIES: aldehyde reductase [unclassified Flavobacterium]MBF4515647.1 aldehyde reductase [Flavobacterium sp. ANB]MTD68650.1 NAD-dependent epimerase/dehydratase family protein [Flavobacterium sp. LC2016-13]